MREDYLSKEQTCGLKGVAALMVLIHHLYLTSGILSGSVFRAVPQAFGYLAVAVFFFLSGYGLAESVKKKGGAYIRLFPRLRLVPFYAIIPLLIVIYAIVRGMSGSVSWTAVANAFFRDTGMIEYGWYFYVILYAYAFFWMVYRLFLRHPRMQAGVFAVGVLYYYASGLLFKQSSVAYECIPALLLGMTWSRNRDKIDHCAEDRFWFGVIGAGMGFAATYVGSYALQNSRFAVLLKTLSALCFVIVAVLLLKRVLLQGAILHWLGTRSLEIYGLQGVPILLLKQTSIPSVPMLYIPLTAVLTMLCAAVAHPVFFSMQSKMKQMLQEGKAETQ